MHRPRGPDDRPPRGVREPEDVAGCGAQRYLATDLAHQAIMGVYDPELNAEIDSALAEVYAACGGT